MIIIRDYKLTPPEARGSALAIGNFDGLHQGHHAILKTAQAECERLDAPLGIMTFYPHPRRFFNPTLPPLKLMRLSDKLEYLQQYRAGIIFLQRFTQEFASLDAKDFVEKVLVQALGVRHVVTGADFVFGKNRTGNADMLADAGKQYCFTTTALPAVIHGGAPCSSSRVRRLLTEGDVQQATEILRKAHVITGRVMHGDKRGRQLGFPTLNVPLQDIFLPKFGVYAVSVRLGNENMERLGVANIGMRPTVGGTRPQLEVHLFGYNRDVYGQKVSVSLHHFLRAEQKFESLDALKAQIDKDTQQAKQLLGADS